MTPTGPAPPVPELAELDALAELEALTELDALAVVEALVEDPPAPPALAVLVDDPLDPPVPDDDPPVPLALDVVASPLDEALVLGVAGEPQPAIHAAASVAPTPAATRATRTGRRRGVKSSIRPG
jgi:DNA-binding helix-hairpin-helix protein with protein kinase domain